MPAPIYNEKDTSVSLFRPKQQLIDI